ncbi:C-X-C chemokine receptor type 3 [Fundulus heteroclitus]|uniref:C-X-C chemokine receptor type 3 n=1 Tax=Fundulus heteroclitus TaxID=8078 RepID=UPI00165A9813|nr:C-X-C chemokine receptor type 3 [Fundulus heteroclitus]XP_021163993.2 C-X-C chemokine receptor type 3 [Fundulus heteroclitus]
MLATMKVTLDGFLNQSDPYEYEDYQGEEESFGSEAVWIPLLYSVMVIVGLLGNGLVLAVLVQKARSWSVSDSFFLQLGVVDILLLFTLPFYAAHANENCGLCSPPFLRMCGAIFKINIYVGIFLLVWVCLDHYLSSTDTFKCFCHRDSLAFMAWLLIWAVSIVLTVIDWNSLKTAADSMPGKALSAHNPPESGVDWQLVSRALHLGVGFLLPVLVLIVCCSHIIVRCRSNSQQKKRPVVLIMSLVTVFLLCWMPYNITLFIDTICYTSKDILSKFFSDHISSLKAAVKITSSVGCISATLRPLLYFFLCRNFRKVLFSLLKCARVECGSSLWELGVVEEAPHDQCQSEEEMKQMTCSQQV